MLSNLSFPQQPYEAGMEDTICPLMDDEAEAWRGKWPTHGHLANTQASLAWLQALGFFTRSPAPIRKGD